MRAVVYEEYGPPEVLRFREVEKPVPRSNEILVKVHATTVSAAAVNIRKGIHPDSRFFTFMTRMMFGLRRPRRPILGYEFAGRVESTGTNVRDLREGDAIFGTTTGLRNGAYAEYVCLPVKWRQGVVVTKPANATYEEAAAVPAGGMAALHLLRRADIQPAMKVLIYGASGSVGTYAVQLARQFGAEVTGVCSTSNLELVRSIGADHVIDYTREDFTDGREKYDVVLDAVGKISRSHGKKSLKKNGSYLSVKSPTAEGTENLVYLKELIEAGKLKPVIDRRYSLKQIVEAHRYVDGGHKKGNVVITVGDSQIPA